MKSSHVRYDEWLDLVADLARHHLGPFPRRLVATQLQETFGCHVSWNWMDEGGWFGWEMSDPVPGFPITPADSAWMIDAILCHPLVCWYTITGQPLAMTNARVPRSLVPAGGHAMVQEMLGPVGGEQQLSMPYVLGPGTYRAFVLARGRDDFTDEELHLARRLQPLLAVLERQAALLAGRPPSLTGTGVTARELAVLTLLRDGLTAVAIGHRLQLSPRTVHTHLRNIYRKLGVGDRMRAVLVAQEAGLLPSGPPVSNGDGAHALRVRWASPSPAQPPGPLAQPDRQPADGPWDRAVSSGSA